MGRAINADQIPAALEQFVQITDGQAWDQVGFSAPPMQVVHDIRAYYEELACELVADGPIAAWGAERWFYDKTEAGKVLLTARRELKKAGAPYLIWFYLVPGSRQ